jgi:quinol monooxygenase YgiN
MYGLIAKITVVPGKCEEMIGFLRESAANMPGCFSYAVARDSAHEDAIWVTEVWETLARHDASLLFPSVQKAVSRAKTIVASFEEVAVTTPVCELGSPQAMLSRLHRRMP